MHASEEKIKNEVCRLVTLSRIQYELEREDVAEKLGIRVSTLDRLVKSERGGADGARGDAEAAAGPGRLLEFPEVVPWSEPVDGAQLLDDISVEIRRYVVLSTAAAHAVALWVAVVHAFERFFIFPRLFITAPEKGCGKTTLLDVIARLVPRPLMASNISAAALFRVIEATRPTLLLDEADSYMRHNEDLRGVVDAGHQRNGAVIRTVGDEHEPRRFSVWAPLIIAAIRNLPGTIEDRSIQIQMRRRRADEEVASFRPDRTSKLDQLARQIARWAKDNGDALAKTDPAMPATIFNRAADNWRPLLAMAELAGDDWPDRARQAVIELSAAADDAVSSGVLLLGDIRGLFHRDPPCHVLFTHEILDALQQDEDRPWPEWKNGQPITSRQLAALLKPYGIRPQTIRRGARTDKGYRLDWFEDAFARYLEPRSVTTSQPNDSAEFKIPRSVTPTVDLTDANAEKASISAECDGVTAAEPVLLDEEAGMDGLTLLRRARDAGLAVAAEDDKLQHKREVMAALLPAEPTPDAKYELAPAWWHRQYVIRTINWELSGARSEGRARGIAWGELQVRRHRVHGTRIPRWRCAGCGEPIGGLPALDLADGNRVHFDAVHGLDCLLSFGDRWRAEAIAGLHALGVNPSAGLKPP
jgi:putative DNA primase/helicase